MKSLKLKTFFLAAGFFAFSASFAQDTTHKPKPDTSKLPRHDSTSMIKTPAGGSLQGSYATLANTSLSNNEYRLEAKIEAINDEKFIKQTQTVA